MQITINVEADNVSDIGEYVRHVATQIEEGFTSGHVDAGNNWDSDIPADLD